jgi:transposase-like protein
MPAQRHRPKKEPVTLSGEVERDEAYQVAGHKGQPGKVARAGRKPRRRRLKGARGRGTGATEKPPVFGMVQRSGEAVIRLLDNVRQKTIKPLILQTVAAGATVHTDEYSIYGRLPEWGYGHKTVNHSAGEYARDEDGDGFHEVHVNTMEGLWSLLRSWLRPHRGISQDKLPLYLGFFEFVYNLKRRGKRLLSSLLGALLKKTPKSI